jgi:hypothetical protein
MPNTVSFYFIKKGRKGGRKEGKEGGREEPTSMLFLFFSFLSA